MKHTTKQAHLGRDPGRHQGVVNPPVYHASTILFPTVADLQKAAAGNYPTSSYGRFGTESTRALESMLAELEGADHAMVTSSGVAAYTVTLLALLQAGDHLLMTDSVYDPTRRFCDVELAKLGVETTYYDPLLGEKIEKLIKPNTRVIFTESPGSLTFEVQDIPAIAAIAHERDITVVTDNTWAALTYNRPFALGTDVSLFSCSKYVGGHSDLIMGAITCNKKHYAKIMRSHRNLGACPGPDDVYLAQRGLRTLAVRLRQHEATAMQLVKWLQGRAEVKKILHPAVADCPGHEIWQRDFSGSCGLFGIVINDAAPEVLADMLDNMKLFKMGYSWGGYESLILPPPNVPRTATSWRPDGILLRIHAGLEDPEDLIDDLDAAFSRFSGA